MKKIGKRSGVFSLGGCQLRLWLKRVLCLIILVSFAYIFIELNREADSQLSPSDEAPVFRQDLATIPLEPDEAQLMIYTPLPRDIVPAEQILNEGENNVKIVDSGKLDIELIEREISPKTQKITDLAEETRVEVFPNGDGIFEDPDALEATYEEPLPEGEYVEENELTPEQEKEAEKNGYHIYRGHKKLSEMDIDAERKPPYFGSQPLLVIVIDDMGVSQSRTKEISSLVAPLTSSFLTYSRHIPQQVAAAKAAGHEIMIHVPMQPKSNIDVAPDCLTIDMDQEQIRQNFADMLKKFPGVRGINNHMGSLFTEHQEKLAPVMELLRQNNLYFLDSKTTAQSAGQQSATVHNVPYAHRHVFLDNHNDKTYILAQLALAEKIARKNSYAIAIGHPKSQTFAALQEWLPKLSQKGIKLVHLSEIMQILYPGLTPKEASMPDTSASEPAQNQV